MTPEERIAKRKAELAAQGFREVPQSENAPAAAPVADIERRKQELMADGFREVQPAEQVGKGTAAALGVAQGASYDMADELAGSAQVSLDDLKDGNLLRLFLRMSPWYAFTDEGQKEMDRRTYKTRRDEVRVLDKAAAEQQPEMYYGGKVGGALATAPVSGGGGLLARGATAGALSGLGASEATTPGGVLADTAAGGATGVAGAGLLAGVGNLAGRAYGAARTRINNALGQASQRAADETTEVLRSMAGRLGAETQQGNRMVENLLRLMQDDAIDPAEREALAALRNTPQYAELVRRLAQSTSDNLPGQAQTIEATRQAVEAARRNSQPAIEQRTAELLSGPEARRQVMERVRRYAPPLLGSVLGPGMGAGAAALIPGADRGDIALGALAGAGMRPAAHAVRRMVQNPAVQTQIWTRVARIAETTPRLLGRFGPALAGAAARGPEAARAAYHILTQQYPEFREMVEKLEKDEAQTAASGSPP